MNIQVEIKLQKTNSCPGAWLVDLIYIYVVGLVDKLRQAVRWVDVGNINTTVL